MKININRLAAGFHELDFEETAEMLLLENLKMFPNPIRSQVHVDKSETHVYIKAQVNTVAHLTCDRCLKEFDQKLTGDVQLYYEIVVPGSHPHFQQEAEDDSVRIYYAEMNEIDMNKDIRDTALLAVPMKSLCSEDCKGICPGCGKNLNVEACTCSGKPMDPRWDALKQLLDQSTVER